MGTFFHPTSNSTTLPVGEFECGSSSAAGLRCKQKSNKQNSEVLTLLGDQFLVILRSTEVHNCYSYCIATVILNIQRWIVVYTSLRVSDTSS
mmetsp:Transcript_34275/g.67492  ORF Transcript_34275/g.67492 Transcript_34275/m.67492 type:complete len:92 (-) Transcript_34275:68-343(-)